MVQEAHKVLLEQLVQVVHLVYLVARETEDQLGSQDQLDHEVTKVSQGQLVEMVNLVGMVSQEPLVYLVCRNISLAEFLVFTSDTNNKSNSCY